MVELIGERLGAKDVHSRKFHYLIASRIPEKIIRAHLGDILVDGADNPPALFTYRMKKYAQEKLVEQDSKQPQIQEASKKVAEDMHIPHQDEN